MVLNDSPAVRTLLTSQPPPGAPEQSPETSGLLPIAQLEDISLRFPQDIRVLDHFSMQVNQGECLGLLGPNGAGKTTLLRLLAGLLIPDSGQIHLFGQPTLARGIALRRRIGYVAQRGGVDLYLTGQENISLLGRLHGLHGTRLARRTHDLLALVGLSEHAAHRAALYSGGMQRRLALACSLVHQPDLLLLDEPTTGLDALGKAAFWGYLLRLQEQGLTIMIASHDTQELERYCQRVILMHRGQALAEGAPSALTGKMAGDLLTLEFVDASQPSQALGILQYLECVYTVLPQRQECSLTLEVKDGSSALPAIAQLLEQAQLRAQRITLSHPTLEDVLLRLAGTTLAATQEAGSGVERPHTGAASPGTSPHRRSPFQWRRTSWHSQKKEGQ